MPVRQSVIGVRRSVPSNSSSRKRDQLGAFLKPNSDVEIS